MYTKQNVPNVTLSQDYLEYNKTEAKVPHK